MGYSNPEQIKVGLEQIGGEDRDGRLRATRGSSWWEAECNKH